MSKSTVKRILLLAGFTLTLVGGTWWVREQLAPEPLPPGVAVVSGRLEGRRVRISSGAEGRVLDLAVREGEQVDSGYVVATIDRRIEQAVLQSGRAQVRAAEENVVASERRAGALESELAFARMEARRYRRLFERDAGPRQAAERAEAAVERLEAEVRAAHAAHALAERQVERAYSELRALEVQLGETTVVASVDGVVEAELVRTGEMVARGTPLIELTRLDDVKLRTYAPLLDVERIEVGAEARVYVEAFPDRPFAGVVERVANEAEFTPRDVHMPEERTTLVFAVDIRIPNPEKHLKDGMPADAYIRWDTTSPWPERRPWE